MVWRGVETAFPGVVSRCGGSGGVLLLYALVVVVVESGCVEKNGHFTEVVFFC